MVKFLVGVLCVSTVGCATLDMEGDTVSDSDALAPKGTGVLKEVATKAQFDKALVKAERVVVIFGAPKWCVACREAKKFWHERGVPAGWTFILWDDKTSKKPLRYSSAFEKAAGQYGKLYSMPACAVLERTAYRGRAAFRIVADLNETRGAGNCTEALERWIEDD